jgi:Rieske Fe-S protein
MTQSTHTAATPSVFASRRRFLQWCLAAVGAAWAGSLVQGLLFPQPTPQEARPVSFPLAELPVGGTRPLTYAGAPALVLRTAEGVRAFSLVCTHLGCTVQWEAAQNQFHCPCHDGRFDQFGQVVSGPPPLPLEQLAAAVNGDQVTVGS